ncbi:unnamed protein product [Prorocentrum cordatum]|uniref:Uncharacterized protein n=1 Tax=Prorocentrum cordatum TaxID=2364126 RepID=A0ABN9QJ58_9DINO|nr:unnamed protein product [Polarella glacialis]
MGYVLGKLECERLFAKAAAGSGGRWDALVVNPSDNIGPILSRHHAEARAAWTPWNCTLARILEGRPFPQSHRLQPWWPVDVRDTAEAHALLLASVAAAPGERYLVCSGEAVRVEELAGMLAELLPEAGIDPAAGPEEAGLDPAAEAELRAAWAGCELRNGKVRAATGLAFRPLADTLRGAAESLLAVGGRRHQVGSRWRWSLFLL